MQPHGSLVVLVARVLLVIGLVWPVPTLPVSAATSSTSAAPASAVGPVAQSVPLSIPSALVSPLSPLSSPLPPPVTPLTPPVIPPEPALPVGPALVTARGGGRVRLTDRVTVDFAPGALRADTTISGTESSMSAPEVDDPTGRQTSAPIEEIAFQLHPDIAAFDAPVTLTVDLTGMLTLDKWGQGYRPMLYYMRPVGVTKTEMVQEEVPATVDPMSRRLVARLAHFSDYRIIETLQIGLPQPWKFVSNLGGVSLFRGAATFQQAIQVPPLPDGTQPHLALAYSSAASDSKAEDEYRLTAGWSLDVPRITLGVKREGIEQYHPSTRAYDLRWKIQQNGQYKLSLGGAEYNLIASGGKVNGKQEYVTESYAPLRVVWCEAGTSCDSLAVNYPVWYDSMATQYSPDCGTSPITGVSMTEYMS